MKLKLRICMVTGRDFANTYAVLAGDNEEADRLALKIKVAEEFCQQHWGEVQRTADGAYEDILNKDVCFDRYFEEKDDEAATFSVLEEEFDMRQHLKRYDGLKTRLPDSITSIEEASAWLRDLFNNGETWHCEDNAAECFPKVSRAGTNQLNKLMQDVYNLPGNDGSSKDMTFDPCGFIVALLHQQTKAE